MKNVINIFSKREEKTTVENHGLGNYCELAMKLNCMSSHDRLIYLKKAALKLPHLGDVKRAQHAIRELWEAGARLNYHDAVIAICSGARNGIRSTREVK